MTDLVPGRTYVFEGRHMGKRSKMWALVSKVEDGVALCFDSRGRKLAAIPSTTSTHYTINQGGTIVLTRATVEAI